MEDDSNDDSCHDDYFAHKRKYYAKFINCISTTSPYTFSTPRPQTFSFPADVISRILFQKQSPFLLLKLYQTCKHFFKKLTVLPTITSCRCSSAWVYDCYFFKEYNFNKKVLFWICDEIGLSDTPSKILRRIYCCTKLKYLKLTNLDISYEMVMQIISGSMIEDLFFDGVNIIDNDGNFVPCHTILKHFPYCTKFKYLNETERFTRESFVALNKLKFKKKFDWVSFNIVQVADNFDIKDAEMIWKFFNQNIDCNTSGVFVSLIRMRSANCKIVETLVRNALTNILPSWNGPEPKIGSPNVK